MYESITYETPVAGIVEIMQYREDTNKFSKDYSGTETFRLEQNYRSTGNILNAANALIDHNSERMGKELWTDDGDGELIQLYAAFNEQDEAQFIIDKVKDWIDKGGLRSENALLYRSNAQSRVLEERLINYGIPYRVYGGLRFFERQEIKDALAYLRLTNNREDDASFERIVNVPTRGIGGRTVEIIRDTARNSGSSMWQAAYHLIAHKELASRALNALQFFVTRIEEMKSAIENLTLHEQIEHAIHESGLIEHYKKEKGERGLTRLENLDQLISDGKSFNVEAFEEEIETSDVLTAFLSHASLEAGERQGDEWDDCVQLMTLHSAKGLEFKQVFLCGLEEGMFPHRLSSEDASKLEEERRLCYVGMTRAMQKLVISYAEKRWLYGEEKIARASRFISEIPTEFLEEIRLGSSVATPVYDGSYAKMATVEDKEAPVKLGQRVKHTKFGEGIVLNYEGQGRHARVQVNFEMAGSKWLVMEYANLQFC